ncbi:MAG: tRNA 2-selenouridine(34) synthase MnmH [Marinilabiliales bacterium]|nr:MAG: tRNA 2-selenouridine(34) synthase MnmH [Marinilabiliales bacterium]
MTSHIGIEKFMELRKSLPVIDVRSPQEFNQGHIPGAVNIPLFSDNERSIVGKAYKNNGSHEAVMAGLDIAGKKLSSFVRAALRRAPGNKVQIHCWRGGMRSEAMGWLLSFAGFDVFILDGGYKEYRRYIRSRWEDPVMLIALSGKTGTGKTDILDQLRHLGQQVIDLEKLACHKGSAFGSLGQPPQPTNEQFENNLADTWLSLDRSEVAWVEDESRSIGSLFIPDALHRKIAESPAVCLEMPDELRVGRLVRDYSSFPEHLLTASVEKIKKKLGRQHAAAATEAIKNKDFSLAARIILKYYDKAYSYDLSQRDPERVFMLQTGTADPAENARLLTGLCREKGLISTVKP